MTWLKDNFVTAIVYLAVFSATLSLVNKRYIAPRWPRLGHFFAAISAFSPADAATFLSELKAIFTVAAAIQALGPRDESKNGSRGFVRARLASGLAVAAVVVVCLIPATAPRSERSEPVERAGISVVQTVGCSFFNSSGGAQVTSSAGAIASCIFLQVLMSVTDPGAVAAACYNVALSQVLAIIDSLLNYYLGPDGGSAEAGVAEAGAPTPAGMICGTGAPPVAGATTCVSQDVIMRLSSLRTSAMKAMAAGAR